MGIRRRLTSIAIAGSLSLPAALVAGAGPAGAVGVGEAGDAGDLPASAQVVGGAVDSISGTITSGADIDMYRICLAGGGTFSATTEGQTSLDTQLFLFDVNGAGVYANDDTPNAVGLQSTLPAGDPLTPAAPGTYHLAISRFNADPLDGGGNAIFEAGGFEDLLGPVDGDAVESWTASQSSGGGYTILLTGTAGCTPSPQDCPSLLTPPPGAIVGTPGPDVLVGTPGPDVIFGLGGDDMLVGMGGDDVLVGGDGADSLRGDAGDDLLCGQGGDDRLDGGDGDDGMSGGPGNDQLTGGPGNDNMLGGDGNDRLIGGPGVDAGDGGPGADAVSL